MNSANTFQRIEGAVIFAAALYFYWQSGFSWVWFAVLLFSIDVSMAGYLVNNKVGAMVYNLGHSLALPILLFVLGFVSNNWLCWALLLSGWLTWAWIARSGLV